MTSEPLTSGQRDDAAFIRLVQDAVAWEDLLNPVQAINGYVELILDDRARLGLVDTLSDVDRIDAAARTLSHLVAALHAGTLNLETDAAASAEAKLRHDLRTPLNAILGYGEMVIEDLEDAGGMSELRADVVRLLEESRQLLGRLDAIVDVTRTGDARTGAGGIPDVVSGLLKTMSPAVRATRAAETGRILVVDDNESNRLLLARRLGQQGHEVVQTHSGREALALLAEREVDLILLDVLMPEMNGLEVLTRLKADARLHAVPVIMISGLNETETVLKCIELGADDYLPKPCDVVLLRARINACLERTRWRERERDILDRLKLEKQRSETLLLNILPEAIVSRLNAGETVIADRFESASMLFADIVGFTAAAASMPASSIVAQLDRLFSAFDALAAELGVEKIKTIGDAYMAATGLPEHRADHALVLANFATGMLDIVDDINGGQPAPLALRIGMHCGPVVAGVIGRRKFIYDVWGDTVNVASRLESHGVPGRIQVSAEMVAALSSHFSFEHRGVITLKGKGDCPAYLIVH